MVVCLLLFLGVFFLGGGLIFLVKGVFDIYFKKKSVNYDKKTIERFANRLSEIYLK